MGDEVTVEEQEAQEMLARLLGLEVDKAHVLSFKLPLGIREVGRMLILNLLTEAEIALRVPPSAAVAVYDSRILWAWKLKSPADDIVKAVFKDVGTRMAKFVAQEVVKRKLLGLVQPACMN